MSKHSISAAGGAMPGAQRMTTTDNTPSKAADRKAHLAEAYRDLEDAIGNIHGACCLMEMVAEEIGLGVETDVEKWIRSKIGGMPGYAITVCNKMQADALNYAVHHLGDLVCKLYDDYHAGFPDPDAGCEKGGAA